MLWPNPVTLKFPSTCLASIPASSPLKNLASHHAIWVAIIFCGYVLLSERTVSCSGTLLRTQWNLMLMNENCSSMEEFLQTPTPDLSTLHLLFH